MQAILKLILAIWPLLKNNPKKSLAAGAAGAGALTMGLYSSVQYPPPAISMGQVQNWPATTDGHVLTYDSATSLWGPEASAGGASALDDLTDVTTSGAMTNDVLVKTAGDWEPTSLSIPVNIQDLSDDGDADTGDVPIWDGAGWVPGPQTGGTGVTTPDGTTAITSATAFNPREYGASYLDTNAYVTSATTTATATFDDTTNIVTTASPHGLTDGDGVCFTNSGGGLPTLASGTLDANTRVWVDVLSSTTFSTHTTRAAAIAGTGDQDYTSAGTGTHTARLKTTVTFTDGAAANTWEEDQYILLLASGPSPTITAPQTTVDGATASYGEKFGTDPTFAGVALTNIVDLNLTTVPLATADEVYVSSSTTLPGGLAASTSYYVRGPIETQTIVIAGTPTGGTYTVTWNGDPSSAIAYNADEATVEAALRASIVGLELVEVTTTGSTPNYTHTVQMVGTTGHNIAQMTSNAASLTGGTPTITHATTDHGRDKWILYTSSGAATTGGAAGLVDITDTGSGTHTMVGRTAFYSSFRLSGGEGEWTDSLALGPIYQFNYRNSGLTGYGVDWQAHTSLGSRSMAWYGFGSSGQELVRVTGAEGTRYGADDSGATDFSSTSDGGGGTSTTIADIQSLIVGDVVEVNSSSSGDSGYDGQWRVTAVTGSNFSINKTWTNTASGYWQRAYNRYRDFGQLAPLEPYKGIPNHDNPPYEWRASVHRPIGTNVWDATNNRLWTVDRNKLTTPFRSYSGSSAPSWSTSTANTVVDDGKSRLRLAMPWVPWDSTSGARRKAMTAKVQSKTSTTVVLQDAAFGDIGSSSLYAAHDDTMPLRNCLAAIDTYGKNATLEFSPGRMPLYTWKIGTNDPDGVAWYTNTGNANAPVYSLFILGDKDQAVSVSMHPDASIRWRAFETEPRIEIVSVTDGTSTAFGLKQSHQLFTPGNRSFTWDDGEVIWEDFCGGMSEHKTSASFGTGPFTIADPSHQHASYNLVLDFTVQNARFFVPNWALIGGDDDDVQRWSQMKLQLKDNIIAVGGPDGAQTILPHGGLDSKGNWLIGYRIWCSHGYYWNVDKYDYSSVGDRYFGFVGANNSPIQARGSSGSGPIFNFVIDDVICEGSSPMIIGDPSSSNPVRGGQISNVRSNITCAELNDTQFTNVVGNINLREGGGNIQITNLIGNLTIDTTEVLDGLEVDGITGTDYLEIANVANGKVDDVKFRHNFVATNETASVTNLTYEWVARGANSEYRLTDRATGRPPSMTQPTRVMIDGLVTTVATTGFGAITTGTAAWGDPDGLGESYLVVKLPSSTDPDTEPTGYVNTAGIAGTPSGLNFERCTNTTISGVQMSRSDAGGIMSPIYLEQLSTSWLKNLTYEEFFTGSTSTRRFIDIGGGGATTLIESGLEGITLHPQINSARVSMIRAVLTDNSIFKFKDFTSPLDNNDNEAGIYITSNGHGTLENCKFQHNQAMMFLDATADTAVILAANQQFGTATGGGTASVTLPATALAHDDAYNGLPIFVLHANGRFERNFVLDYTGSSKVVTTTNNWNTTPSTTSQVQVGYGEWIRTIDTGATVMPVQIRSATTMTATADGVAQTVEGNTFWYRNTNDKLYITEADANTGSTTGDLEFSSGNALLFATFVDFANATVLSTYEPFNGGHPANWVKGGKGVDLRGGGGNWKYAEITAAQTDNLDLYPVDTHIFTTDDTSNLVTGFNGGWPGRIIRVMNQDGADNINFDHANGEADSLVKNQFISPTGADFVLGPNEMVAMVYVGGTGWVIQNYVAQNEVLPLERFDAPLWAWEPRRHFALALAA